MSQPAKQRATAPAKRVSRQLHIEASAPKFARDGTVSVTISARPPALGHDRSAGAKLFAANLAAVTPMLGEVVDLQDHAKAMRIMRMYQPAITISDDEDTLWAAQQAAGEAIFGGTRWLTADELGKKIGGAKSNPGMKPNRWKLEGKLFAVPWQGVDRYPLYAVSPGKTPWPVMQEVLKLFAGMDPWRMAAWFESTNAWLNGKRPREVLADADKVMRAAKRKGGWNHG